MPAPEAINFNKDSIFQLKPIEPEKINPMVRDFWKSFRMPNWCFTLPTASPQNSNSRARQTWARSYR